MKKYLKILPLILYPYTYVFFLIILWLLSVSVEGFSDAIRPAFLGILIVFTVLNSIWVFAVTIRRVSEGFRQYTPAETAKMNLAVKGWHIPAYVIHFLVGIVGAGSTIMSVNAFGVGLITFAVVIDLVTILLSGIHASGCAWRLKKEGILSAEKALLAGFGSFIYCVDILVACYLADLCRKKEKEAELLQADPLQAPDGKGKAAAYKNKAFKYLRAIPLILYPYAYMIGFRFFGTDFIPFFVFGAFIYTCIAFLFAIRAAVGALWEYDPLEAAGMNLAVKGLQIPAYILNFFLGALIGAIASVWGIGFVALFVLMDVLTIALSGIYAIGCIRRLKKAGFLSAETALLAGFGSFIFVVDVIAALVLVIKCSKKAEELRRAEAAAAFAASVPQQERQAAAENPLPPPLSPVPPTSAPAPNETASSNAASVPQRKKRQKPAERPLPPPFVPNPPKPAPAQKETADETAREE